MVANRWSDQQSVQIGTRIGAYLIGADNLRHFNNPIFLFHRFQVHLTLAKIQWRNFSEEASDSSLIFKQFARQKFLTHAFQLASPQDLVASIAKAARSSEPTDKSHRVVIFGHWTAKAFCGKFCNDGQKFKIKKDLASLLKFTKDAY